jgi:parallel beta-helix repeat protein
MQPTPNLLNKAIRTAAGAMLAVILVVSPVKAAPQAHVTLTVNSPADTGGLPCLDGTCTLRSAIQIANLNAATIPYSIRFSGDFTINLLSFLDPIKSNIAIFGDGHTIVINGSSQTQNIFHITGSYVTIQSLRMYGSAAGFSNIWISDAASNVLIDDNVIGDSDPAIGCQAGGFHSYGGIYVNSTATGVSVATISRNIIECQLGSTGSPLTTGNGIDLINVQNVTVGSSFDLTTEYGNVIRDNHLNGINLDDASSCTVQGNTIVDNAGSGVVLTDGAHDNTIGSVIQQGNLISGNAANGVTVTWAVPVATPVRANHNTISGNIIGLNAAQTAVMPNGQAGIALIGAGDGNAIGLSGNTNYRQVIGGNASAGIFIQDTNGTLINEYNWIGSETAGLGNAGPGIRIVNSSNTSLDGSFIQHNTGAGIAIEGDGSLNNSLWFWEDDSNGGLAVDLLNDGPTNNADTCTPRSGPNHLYNFPTITHIDNSSPSIVFSGTSCGASRIILYEAVGNPRAAGGGGKLLGGHYSPGPNWSYQIDTDIFPREVVATATDVIGGGNTSEFGQPVSVPPRPVLFLPAVRH